jgi:hypothetical protein
VVVWRVRDRVLVGREERPGGDLVFLGQWVLWLWLRRVKARRADRKVLVRRVRRVW